MLIAGMQKRPMGFPNMPGNQNFVQGQVSGTTPGTPGGGAGQQLQSGQAMPHQGNLEPWMLKLRTVDLIHISLAFICRPAIYLLTHTVL